MGHHEPTKPPSLSRKHTPENEMTPVQFCGQSKWLLTVSRNCIENHMRRIIQDAAANRNALSRKYSKDIRVGNRILTER